MSALFRLFFLKLLTNIRARHKKWKFQIPITELRSCYCLKFEHWNLRFICDLVFVIFHLTHYSFLTSSPSSPAPCASFSLSPSLLFTLYLLSSSSLCHLPAYSTTLNSTLLFAALPSSVSLEIIGCSKP